jgi:lactam utilization protein B
MIGTLHERIYPERGHEFVSEFYADLDYSDDGTLIVTREHDERDPWKPPRVAFARSQKTGFAASVARKLL